MIKLFWKRQKVNANFSKHMIIKLLILVKLSKVYNWDQDTQTCVSSQENGYAAHKCVIYSNQHLANSVYCSLKTIAVL